MRTVSALLCTLLLLGSSDASSRPLSAAEARAGEIYKSELAGLIDRSDRIVVTEHSFKYDLLGPDRALLPSEVIYETRTLDVRQRQRFSREIRSLNGKTQDSFSACTFEPHHRVEFYSGDKKLSSMEICFQCGEIEWRSTETTPPQAIYLGLFSFIESIGLHPEQDWQARAKAAAQLRR